VIVGTGGGGNANGSGVGGAGGDIGSRNKNFASQDFKHSRLSTLHINKLYFFLIRLFVKQRLVLAGGLPRVVQLMEEGASVPTTLPSNWNKTTRRQKLVSHVS